MPTENDLEHVRFAKSDLPRMQKGLVMLIGAIIVALRSNLKCVANTVEHIAFGADQKGNDAKAVETWYPKSDQLVGAPKHQFDEQKMAA